MKPILQYPDKRLTTSSSKVTDFKEAKKIAEELVDVTKSVERAWNIWLGMAAPQIGYNKRIILVRDSFKNYTVIVNPEIIEQKWQFYTLSRCFSLQGVYLIKTYYYFKVRYQDLEEKYHTKVYKWGKAAVLEQEINHLDGVLISDMGRRML